MQPFTLPALRAEVEARFLAAGPRPWPAPRPGHQGPAEEEYSRCLQPDKYVITQQRATAWASALADAGVATIHPMGSRVLAPWGAVETTSITATRPDAEPVFLHFSSEHLPGVIVAYGRPEVVLAAQPVCECDACDEGSDPLIEAIDEAFESVVLGEVLIEHGKGSSRIVTLNGESTSSRVSPDSTWVIGHWNGAPWLD